MKNTIALFVLLLLIQFANAQKQQTITYFQNDTLKLDLDVFLPEKTSAKTPLFLYMHGGGFSVGERSYGHSICNYLAQNGIASATISYTLYMKNKKFSCDGSLPEKIRAFQHGANDLWLATSYFIANATKFNIDSNKIFIGGTSAGGEAVLHAAFWDRKTMEMYQTNLPEGFRYAGLVSGAAAIMDLNLITSQKQIPMLLFHGNADVTVPYGTAAHHYCKPNSSGWLMLFGSYSIYEHLKANNGIVSLHTFCGGDHGYSGYLFEKNQKPVLDFVSDVVAGKKFSTHVVVPTGKKTEKSAVYGFCD